MSTSSNESIANALEGLIWPNMAIGNKVIIKAAIEALRKERGRAQPVYQMLTGGGWFDISKEHYEGADKTRGVVFRVVYTAPPAPPAPVVPDELTWEEAPCESIEYVYGWNDCRAAMLRGTEDATS